MIPSFRSWRHRDGGFVVQVFDGNWKVEFLWARHRRDRYGVRVPFELSVMLYESEAQR